MAVADVFDALISPGVHKSAMRYNQAREVIAEGGGSHFDPGIAATFLEESGAMTTLADQYNDRGHPGG